MVGPDTNRNILSFIQGPVSVPYREGCDINLLQVQQQFLLTKEREFRGFVFRDHKWFHLLGELDATISYRLVQVLSLRVYEGRERWRLVAFVGTQVDFDAGHRFLPLQVERQPLASEVSEVRSQEDYLAGLAGGPRGFAVTFGEAGDLANFSSLL